LKKTRPIDIYLMNWYQ